MAMPRTMFHRTRYRCNGIDLAVTVQGDGPAVLFVHGFPDSGAVWREQVPALVAAGYRVIVPDMRGCGESDAPAGTRAYRIETLSADLAALLDVLGVTKAVLVAHDWGAVIGWNFCMRYPERVERYVALSVGHPNAYASGGWEQKRKGWYVLFFQLRGIAEWALRRNDWRLLRRLTDWHGEARHWIPMLDRPGRLTAAINYYRANLAMLLRNDWPDVDVPVYGLWSSKDACLAESQMLQSRRFVTASWHYDRIDGAGHWMQLDAPERVNALLLAEFSAMRRARGRSRAAADAVALAGIR